MVVSQDSRDLSSAFSYMYHKPNRTLAEEIFLRAVWAQLAINREQCKHPKDAIRLSRVGVMWCRVCHALMHKVQS